MGEMILQLLGSLDIGNLHTKLRDTINRLIANLLIIIQPLYLQPHISTNTPNPLICLHMHHHFIESRWLGSQPHIQQHSVLGFELLTETVEEPAMRGKLPPIFVLCHHEQVHFWRIVLLAIEFVLLSTIAFVLGIILTNFQPKGAQQSQTLPRVDVLMTVPLSLTKGIIDQRPTRINILSIFINKERVRLPLIFLIILSKVPLMFLTRPLHKKRLNNII